MPSSNSRRTATIDDVARVAGVSRAAVSKVLRDAYGISDSMRTRVNSAIEQLNYRPSAAARSLRGASFTIGVEVPDYGNQFFTRVVRGASRALNGTPYQLIIAPGEGSAPGEFKPLEALANRQVDGIVAISPYVPVAWLDRLAEHTPVVMLGRHDSSEHYDSVVGDDVAGTNAVMDHLFELGHRSIAHFTHDEAVTDRTGTPHALRLETYLKRMRAAGLQDEISVWRFGSGEDAPLRAATEMLRNAKHFTAVFAGHDDLALAVTRAAVEAGADISVVGYDDIPLAGRPEVSLTTVDQAGESMGNRAVALLLERIAGRTEAVHDVFEPILRRRASSRPVAK